MNPFQWLKTITRSNPLENPEIPLGNAYDLLVNNSSATGVAINRQTVLGNPAIFRAVNLISQSVAKIPLVLYRRGQDDSRQKASNHPAYRLLLKSPSELYHAHTFKQTIQAHALLFGNGYAYVVRDELARPVELLILDPEYTTADIEKGRLIYKTMMSDVEFKLPAADVLHIKGLSHDGIIGYSVMDVMRDALGLGLGLQRYGAAYFKNGGKPSVVITLPPHITDKHPEKLERFRQMWGQTQVGLHNAHKPALLQAGSSITTLGGSNEEGQWLQSREHDLIMVSDILGVPCSMLGSQVNVSYGSLEMDLTNFLSTGLDPWLCQWSAECDTKLLTERQKQIDSHFFEANRKALLQVDGEKEVNLIIAELNNGLISWEESRKLLNLSTEKTEAEEWRRPSNIVVEGEEAPEPAQQPETGPEDAQPEEDAPEGQEGPENAPEGQPERSEGDSRLSGMVKLTLERLVTRCRKSAEAGKLDPAAHVEVWADALSPLGQEAWAERQLQKLYSELEAVLPEQRQEVFARLDVDKMVNEIIGDN